MIIVKFRADIEWDTANWVFAQFADDVIASEPLDEELKSTLREALALGALYLEDIHQLTRTKVLKAMQQVAIRTLNGEVIGWRSAHPTDKEGISTYEKAIARFVDTASKVTE